MPERLVRLLETIAGAATRIQRAVRNRSLPTPSNEAEPAAAAIQHGSVADAETTHAATLAAVMEAPPITNWTTKADPGRTQQEA